MASSGKIGLPTSEADALPGIEPEVLGPGVARGEEILTREALQFLSTLHHQFSARRLDLLAARGSFRVLLRSGQRPDFSSETRSVRESEWKVAPPPQELLDRRVEITGPPERKMVINALNSGARVYMADFEDSHSPTWTGTISGQVNLLDAVRRTISFTAPSGKEYRLVERPAVLMVRPRGWHLEEAHVRFDGCAISASLFDFGLFLFHNGPELVRRGSGPYFYLPKMEHYLEARLWNEIFQFSEDRLGLPRGTIRPTVLIETLPAAFQMDEILWEFRERSLGLNCGRWDYLFSCLKQFQDDPHSLSPDRDRITMESPFLAAYSHLLVRTCHRRGAHAMGGMAAQIPIRGNETASELALARVSADKRREARVGHDGTWVAHPGLVPTALEVFDREMPGPNQIERSQPVENIGPEDLLRFPTGPITDRGVRRNTRAACRYLASWLAGNGCVPIDFLMEDAATAEIARSQLWQWIHHGGRTVSGRAVTLPLVKSLLAQEVEALRQDQDQPGPAATAEKAARLLSESLSQATLEDFLTLHAYPELEDRP